MATSTRDPDDATGDQPGRLSIGDRLHSARVWVPALAMLIAAGISLYVGYLFVNAATDETPPTELEQTGFAVFTLVVGAGLSWATSHYYFRQDARERFEQLARPALRRVVTARASAEGLIAAAERRREDSGEPEAFLSLRELLDQHAATLNDAILDWQELLPTEALTALDASELHARVRQDSELSALTERLTQLEERQADGQQPDPAIAALQKEVARLRTEVSKPTIGVGLSSRGVITAPSTFGTKVGSHTHTIGGVSPFLNVTRHPDPSGEADPDAK